METSYDIPLVILSYLISVFGSFTALQLAIRIPTAKGNEFYVWLIGAAVALGGGGIWSMHFIAMLAFNTTMNMHYNPFITIASLILAVMVVSLGFLIVAKGSSSFSNLLLAGIIAGLGVCGMHYLGMEAMVMPADISYKPALLILSIIIAIVAATVAIWLAFNLRGHLQRFGSAFVMGIAVSGMHYTGMFALVLTPNSEQMDMLHSGVPATTLGLSIFGVTLIVLAGFLGLSFYLTKRAVSADKLIFD